MNIPEFIVAVDELLRPYALDGHGPSWKHGTATAKITIGDDHFPIFLCLSAPDEGVVDHRNEHPVPLNSNERAVRRAASAILRFFEINDDLVD